MAKKICTGAALAAFSTLATAGAAAGEPVPQNDDGLIEKTAANTGIISGHFGTNYGAAHAAPKPSGIAHTHGTPTVNIDYRGAVPNPDTQHIGGTLFGANKASCDTAPVTQTQGDTPVLRSRSASSRICRAGRRPLTHTASSAGLVLAAWSASGSRPTDSASGGPLNPCPLGTAAPARNGTDG